MSNYLDQLSEFICKCEFDHLPADVIKRACEVTADSVAAIAAGAQEEEMKAVIERMLAAGSPVRSSTYSDEALSKYSWLPAQREIYNRFYLLPQDPQIAVYLGPLTEALYAAFQGEKSAEESLKEAETRILEALG